MTYRDRLNTVWAAIKIFYRLSDLKLQKCISYSLRGWEVQEIPCLFAASSHGIKRKDVSGISFIGVLISFMRTLLL